MNHKFFSFISLGFLSTSIFFTYISQHEPPMLMVGIMFFLISLLLAMIWQSSEKADITRKKRISWEDGKEITPGIMKYRARRSVAMLITVGGIVFCFLIVWIIV